jgi:hypothetical protein
VRYRLADHDVGTCLAVHVRPQPGVSQYTTTAANPGGAGGAVTAAQCAKGPFGGPIAD